jgi:hypothetical protein
VQAGVEGLLQLGNYEKRRTDFKLDAGWCPTFLNIALRFIITIQFLLLFPAVLFAMSILGFPQFFCTSPFIFQLLKIEIKWENCNTNHRRDYTSPSL